MNSRIEYESCFAEFVGAVGARAFVKGRHALVILLKALGVKPGDKVGVCSFTCLSVVEAVKRCDAIPVYLDVDEHLCIDYQQILKHSPGSIKVIILQHTFGIPGQFDKLLSACRQIKAVIIEDCAHAIGCYWREKPLGQFGEAAIYSFQWGKPYTTGSGGMLTVNSKELLGKVDEQILEYAVPMPIIQDIKLACQRGVYHLLCSLGCEYIIRQRYCRLRELGFIKTSLELDVDFKLYKGYVRLAGNLVSRAGLKQLRGWPKLQTSRRKNVDLIKKMFSMENLPLWPVPSDADVTMLRYPIFVGRKDEVLENARKQCLDLAGWYLTPVHPVDPVDLNKVGYELGVCPRAEDMIDKVIHVPTGFTLNSRCLEKMIKLIKEHCSAKEQI